MEDLIITRIIDEFGNIVIPIEIRKKLNLTVGEKLRIINKGESIILSKKKDTNNSLVEIDELGRIKILKKFRDIAKLKEKQEVNIFIKNNDIVMQKKISTSLEL